MNYFPEDVGTVFQELPDHISITFQIAGCGLKCPNCHSPHLQNAENGRPLSPREFQKILDRFDGFVDAVIFLGGESNVEMMTSLLKMANERNFSTCLYTGKEKEDVPESILENLTYLKTGPYIESKGGLDKATTNQKMVNLKTGEDVTYKFNKELPKHKIGANIG